MFGALALLIAGLGAFGVVSYLAAQRTREMGIRLALGGSASAIARMIVAEGLRIVVAGILAGMAVAFVAAPAVAGMLFATPPRDPAVAAATIGVLVASALIAAAFPAWRASRVSPMIAIRAE